MAIRFNELLATSLGSCAFLAALGFAPASHAYCRATTCNPELEDCELDEHGCSTAGVPLWWRRGQVDLVIDSAGSEYSVISEQQAFLALSNALQSFSSVVCPGNGPRAAFVLSVLGSGGGVEHANGLNEVGFIDSRWPYAPQAVAYTNIEFDLDTGEIIEADIELNSEDFTFAIDGKGSLVDLQAVLTHELGHVLGLAHSDVSDATMQAETSGLGAAELRTLEDDDSEGVCAVHADSWQAEPPAKETGGCSVTTASSQSDAAVAWLAALALVLRLRQSRARSA